MRKIQKLFMLLNEQAFRRGLVFGVGAAVEHIQFLRHQSFATVLDAGANKGQFSLVARHQFPLARITAFEPLEGPAATYRKVFAHDGAVRLFKIALGSREGRQTIHVSRRPDSSSLLPIGFLQNQVFPGTDEIGTEQIEVRTLDSVLTDETLDRPAILKIDVQGYELELLKGAEVILAQIDSIYAELSFFRLYEKQALADEVLCWLDARNFKLSGVYNISYDEVGRPVQADFHFRKN